MSMNQIFAIDIVAMLALQSILHRAHIAHIVFQQLTYPARLQKRHRSSHTLAQSNSVIFHLATISQLEPHL